MNGYVWSQLILYPSVYHVEGGVETSSSFSINDIYDQRKLNCENPFKLAFCKIYIP